MQALSGAAGDLPDDRSVPVPGDASPDLTATHVHPLPISAHTLLVANRAAVLPTVAVAIGYTSHILLESYLFLKPEERVCPTPAAQSSLDSRLLVEIQYFIFRDQQFHPAQFRCGLQTHIALHSQS